MSRRAPGPYSKATTLARLDGRCRAAQLAKSTRAALIAHVGGKPSATQLALIDQAVQLKVRLRMMDDQFVAAGEQSPHAERSYLAWSGHYTRTVAALGIAPSPERVPTLDEYLANRAAQAHA